MTEDLDLHYSAKTGKLTDLKLLVTSENINKVNSFYLLNSTIDSTKKNKKKKFKKKLLKDVRRRNKIQLKKKGTCNFKKNQLKNKIKKGKTMLMYAAYAGKEDVVEYLLSQGALVTLSDV